jgi:hypothetical protein
MTDTIRNIWDSTLGRLFVIGAAVGWVPFFMLSMAHAALTK